MSIIATVAAQHDARQQERKARAEAFAAEARARLNEVLTEVIDADDCPLATLFPGVTWRVVTGLIHGTVYTAIVRPADEDEPPVHLKIVRSPGLQTSHPRAIPYGVNPDEAPEYRWGVLIIAAAVATYPDPDRGRVARTDHPHRTSELLEAPAYPLDADGFSEAVLAVLRDYGVLPHPPFPGERGHPDTPDTETDANTDT